MTEAEFPLPGGRRKVRPDAVWQAPEIGVPVLMVEVDRSTMSPKRVAAKFTAYRELFRTKVKSTDPAPADEDPADRLVHWWRRTWPGHTPPGPDARRSPWWSPTPDRLPWPTVSRLCRTWRATPGAATGGSAGGRRRRGRLVHVRRRGAGRRDLLRHRTRLPMSSKPWSGVRCRRFCGGSSARSPTAASGSTPESCLSPTRAGGSATRSPSSRSIGR
ncbi:replication-relaxation family protein [Kitasatospora sp. NPDC002227]|uniref:replication-relaxation family protein n=1 Tax=Kitasatospora sp. NPDC002227 TaxID=3154773 RepID=UPI00332E5ADA